MLESGVLSLATDEAHKTAILCTVEQFNQDDPELPAEERASMREELQELRAEFNALVAMVQEIHAEVMPKKLDEKKRLEQ